jgi:hypothetical protein
MKVLFREFFGQFFGSESVTSEHELRQTLVWVIVFLFVPGVMLMVQLFFQYQGIVIRAIKLQQFDRLDDTLAWIAFLYVTYSMVAVGFIAVVAWDALTFDRRDAMVLGPLPLSGAAIVTAKVGALAAFLLAASTAINLPNAVVFAAATGDQLGTIYVARHFAALFTATTGAAVFVFCALVMLRAAVSLAAGPRAAAIAGSLLQFVFVLALLGVVILTPAVARLPHRALVNPDVTGWLPNAWYLGLFEQMRGSTRAYFQPLAARAMVATAIVVAGAVMLSIAGFQRQMQRALAPSADTGAGGGARLTRLIARALAGGNRAATATTEFMLLTLARNRAQQTPLAMNAAVGVALVGAALTRVRDFEALTHPRSLVLWIPLVIAYWTAIGLRASFFVPSELPASWTFQINGPEPSSGYWAGVRAATVAVLLPPALVLAMAITVPLLGWRVFALHAVVTTVVVILLAEWLAVTIDFVPFTRAYEPGHARLKTRWPLYLLGMYVFAIWPARIELRMLRDASSIAPALGAAVAAMAALAWWGRRRAGNWLLGPRDEPPDAMSGLRVLDLGGVMKRAVVGPLVLALAAAAGGCADPVDVATAIQIDSVTTRWVDEGVVDGKHKIVPAATFILKNVSDKDVGLVQVNAVFRQANSAAEWSSAFVPAAANRLPAGSSSGTVVVRGTQGYTSIEVPDAMLRNSQFVDAKVDIYVKSGSSNWIKRAEPPIARQLR